MPADRRATGFLRAGQQGIRGLGCSGAHMVGCVDKRVQDGVGGGRRTAEPVHVWAIDLADEALAESSARVLLDPSEKRGADARAGAGRRRYVAAHAALRMILATWLGDDAGSIRFARKCGRCLGDDHGQPWVVGAATLGFSLSHSGDLSIVALADGVRVGADVEEIRARPRLARLARRVLGPGEYEAWSSLPETAALRSFLESWTAKEAYLKATGEGISRPMAGVPAVAPPGWSLARPAVATGHVAAVMVEVPKARIRVRSLRAEPGP